MNRVCYLEATHRIDDSTGECFYCETSLGLECAVVIIDEPHTEIWCCRSCADTEFPVVEP